MPVPLSHRECPGACGNQMYGRSRWLSLAIDGGSRTEEGPAETANTCLHVFSSVSFARELEGEAVMAKEISGGLYASDRYGYGRI